MENRLTWMIETTVPGVVGGNTLRNIGFNDQPFLRDKPTLSLEIFSVNDVTLSPTGVAVVTSAIIQTAFLTLYMSNPDNAGNMGQWIQNVPLWSLHSLDNGTDPYERKRFEMAGQVIMWEKSFITLGANIGNTDPISFLINVGYAWPGAQTQNS
jgi:hypothetical protein